MIRDTVEGENMTRILIVEDEQNLAKAIGEIMNRAGYETDLVYDGVDAVKYAASRTYSVIILDIMLPDLDGYGVVAELQKRSITTPILMLTALSETKDKVIGLNCGADDYLAKPFDNEELIARVNALIRRSSQPSESLSYEDLTLNLRNSTLWSRGKSVELRPKEFEVLKELFLHPEETVSVKTLSIRAWDGEATSNNVEVYMTFIRRKLSLLKSVVGIRKVQGVGYVMAVQQAAR